MSGWAKPVKDGSTHSMLKGELRVVELQVGGEPKSRGRWSRGASWLLDTADTRVFSSSLHSASMGGGRELEALSREGEPRVLRPVRVRIALQPDVLRTEREGIAPEGRRQPRAGERARKRTLSWPSRIVLRRLLPRPTHILTFEAEDVVKIGGSEVAGRVQRIPVAPGRGRGWE